MATLHSKRPGIVYVMTFGEKLRVGHFSTSQVKREKQVFNGTGEPWSIIYSVRLRSKLEACAVEATVHAILSEYEGFHQPQNSRMQVFNCAVIIAKQALKKAVKILQDNNVVEEQN